MEDDKVRERHGTACSNGTGTRDSFIVYEGDKSVIFSEQGGQRHLSPPEARYLARKLYRLARRIEKRQEAGNG